MSNFTLERWGIAARQYTKPRRKKSAQLGQKITKSDAQVETVVRPQVVSPQSGELKLGRLRRYRLMGRFSREEKERVKASAEAAELSVNEYIRATALGAGYKPPFNPELVKALQALNLELTRQGTNLNQIAHLRNGGKATDAEADSMLGIVARSMLNTHKAVLAALSAGKEPSP